MNIPEEDRIALESKNPVSSSFPDVTKQAWRPRHTEKSIYYMHKTKSR